MEYSDKYEWDDDFILLGLHNKEGVFQQSFLYKVDSLTKQLKRFPDITSVVSPTTINILRKTPFTTGVVSRPFINIDQPEKYKADSTKIFQRQEFIDRLFAKNGKSVALLISQTPSLTVDHCKILSQEVDSLASTFDFDEIHYAGKCFSQTAYVTLVQKEVGVFVLASALMIVFFLWISYRKLWSGAYEFCF